MPEIVIEHLTIEANGLSFYGAAAGPKSAPLVLLLHGFPEFSYGWRRQLAPLAASGLRVVAIDQRGYGHSDKPEGVPAYRVEVLAADVVAIAAALGHDRFDLVGHDWGGIVAWRVASDHARHVERLAILNAPNLDVAWRHALTSPSQLLKSSYVAMFQLPVLPELALSAFDSAALASALQQTSRPGTFTEDELKVYREAWAKTGAMTAMLNWYRALPLAPTREPVRIAAPTRIIWGDRDSALDASLAEKCLALCDDGEVVHLADATHWVQHEEPERVNALLSTLLAR